MKRVVLIWILVFCSVLCKAQNWNCFVPGQKQFFINSDGYLKGIRIDSVRTSGSNTVYYPFHTIRAGFGDSGGSWVGKNVISDTAGTFYFDNLFRDTILIKTLADSGEKWVFYSDKNDTTRLHYLATVVAKDTMTVLGVVDSIKKIQLNAYRDTAMVADTVNGFEIILSKYNGFVHVPDLFTFPYHKPNMIYMGGFDYYLDEYCRYGENKSRLVFKRIKYVLPDVADMRNYETDDGFRYESYFSDANEYHRWGVMKVINKTIVSINEVDYTFHEWYNIECLSCYPHMPATSGDGSYTIKVYPGIITSLFDTVHMPEEYNNGYSYWYNPEDTSFCHKSAMYRYSTDYITYVEPCGEGLSYKVGCGKIDTGICYDPMGGGYSWWITGARKNGIDCGLGVGPMKVNSGISTSIYPNPANDEVVIKLANNTPDLQIDVLNMLGQTVLSAHTRAQQYSFSVRNLPNGMYEVRVGDGKVWSHQKLVIQH